MAFLVVGFQDLRTTPNSSVVYLLERCSETDLVQRGALGDAGVEAVDPDFMKGDIDIGICFIGFLSELGIEPDEKFAGWLRAVISFYRSVEWVGRIVRAPVVSE